MTIPSVNQLLDFSGKTVLITGADRGIGAGIARRFAEAGANVAIHYRSGKIDAEALAAELRASNNNQAHAFHADLTDESDVANLMQSVQSHFGQLDVAINNAGAFPNSSIENMSLADWKSMLAANTDTVFLCTREAAAIMKPRGGAIVNIASISGLNAGPEHAHYNSAKAAVIMFTQSAAQEFGAFNIRVNAVSPGVIAREGIQAAWPEGVARWEEKTPLSRMGTPEDVADACLFLSSPTSRFITGVNLPVEGGILATPIY